LSIKEEFSYLNCQKIRQTQYFNTPHPFIPNGPGRSFRAKERGAKPLTCNSPKTCKYHAVLLKFLNEKSPYGKQSSNTVEINAILRKNITFDVFTTLCHTFLSE
jgi:hypothetical protein